MPTLQRVSPHINPLWPSGASAFFDTVVVWSPQPMTQVRLHMLMKDCGHIERRRNGEVVKGSHAPYVVRFPNKKMVERWRIHQPGLHALKWLARQDVRLTEVHPCLDLTYKDEATKIAAYEFFDRSFVKKRSRASVTYVGLGETATRYTNRRVSPNNAVAYADRHSKDTGELFCLHLEWRVRGAAALQRAGLATIRDMLRLDFKEFWSERLLLYWIQHERIVEHQMRLHGSKDPALERRIRGLFKRYSAQMIYSGFPRQRKRYLAKYGTLVICTLINTTIGHMPSHIKMTA